jgi:hypothetical protein
MQKFVLCLKRTANRGARCPYAPNARKGRTCMTMLHVHAFTASKMHFAMHSFFFAPRYAPHIADVQPMGTFICVHGNTSIKHRICVHGNMNIQNYKVCFHGNVYVYVYVYTHVYTYVYVYYKVHFHGNMSIQNSIQTETHIHKHVFTT